MTLEERDRRLMIVLAEQCARLFYCSTERGSMRYKERPRPPRRVDAEQWFYGSRIDGVVAEADGGTGVGQFGIVRLETGKTTRIYPGWWLARDEHGCVSVLSPESFAALYEQDDMALGAPAVSEGA